MRAKLITVCDSWLHGQLKSPKVPKYYRKQFTESLETWQEQHAESKKPNSV